jgi:surfeit locus 1 family protein
MGHMRISAKNIGWISLTAVVVATFGMLGQWQLDRAEEKRAMFTAFHERGAAPRINLNDRLYRDKPVADMAGYAVSVDGQYASENVLLDNQVFQGRAGYMVYTPLKVTNSGYSILINRGWIAMAAERSRAPEFAAMDQRAVKISGRASRPSATGLTLSGAEQVERLGPRSLRVQRIDLPQLSQQLRAPLAAYTVLLDSDNAGGFARDWRTPGNDDERHLGYAFQWFAMAATVIVLCAVLLWRARV